MHVVVVRRELAASRPSRGRPGGCDASLLLRKSTASSFVPSGDQSPATAYIPSPKTWRVSPVSRSRIHTSMSVGVRAFAEYASFVPSGENAPAPTKCCTSGSSVICSGQPSAGSRTIELVELVAVAVGAENDRAVRAARRRSAARSRAVKAVSWSGQPPSTGTRQRLNWPGDVADEEARASRRA